MLQLKISCRNSVVFVGLMMEYTHFNADVLSEYEDFLSTFSQPTNKALSVVPTGRRLLFSSGLKTNCYQA